MNQTTPAVMLEKDGRYQFRDSSYLPRLGTECAAVQHPGTQVSV